ncbi:laccase domain-containing protein [Leptospira kemamanensis]|uniref:Laccase domain-containing protein n=1 Tax=Leptospira kemamanensis TaxID=2484942 RepID=A0A4R9JRM7_9LEPT|nr:polyphenol oxidase family protein [Leptospira kemamanensis]TGL53032.1 laccase domain-containing protein [Leptospira kemamanensis]
MRKEISLPYGKVVFGSLGKKDLTTSLSDVYGFPKSPIEWSNFTKSVLAKETNLPSSQITCLNQVHGDQIDCVSDSTMEDPGEVPIGDGLYTSQKNQVLVVRTADCVPVFLHSTKRPFVSVLHSGWKGTKLGITEKMIQTLLDEGDFLEDLSLEFGPYIQRSNYEVGEDVATDFQSLGNDVCMPKGNGKFLLDVGLAIETRVKRQFGDKLQIRNDHVDVFQSPLYFSHRAKEEGRNLNFILWES